jgi:mono/diheme cytochrome c family protein
MKILIAAALLAACTAVARAVPREPSRLYMLRCAECHGENGRGRTPRGRKLEARDFTDPEFQQLKSDRDLIEMVENGKEGKMPAFGKILTPEQIRSLVVEDVRGFSGR